MRTRTVRRLAATSALAATVAGGVAVGTAFTGPALASQVTATGTDGTAEDREDGLLADRVQAIRDVLAGLVGEGTITQEQADTVAETLGGSDALRGRGHVGDLRDPRGTDHDRGRGGVPRAWPRPRSRRAPGRRDHRRRDPRAGRPLAAGRRDAGRPVRLSSPQRDGPASCAGRRRHLGSTGAVTWTPRGGIVSGEGSRPTGRTG